MSVSETKLEIDTSVCIDSAAVPPEAFAIGPAAGLLMRPLRRFDDGTLRSGLLDIPSGWSSSRPLAVRATLQLAVLSGGLCLGATELTSGAFVVVPTGAALPPLRAVTDVEILLISDPDQSINASTDVSGAIVTRDMHAIEPIVPVVDGKRLEGFERRVLWVDPTTGADTRLLKVPAGFRGFGPSYHPVHEEIFCLSGDIAPDDTRPMRAGSFLWNPANSVHGFKEQSLGGCTILEWHDGPWSIDFYRGPVGVGPLTAAR
jgi:hypothetical protein